MSDQYQHLVYLHQREAQECAAAHAATDKAVKALHFEMAAQFAVQIGELKASAGVERYERQTQDQP